MNSVEFETNQPLNYQTSNIHEIVKIQYSKEGVGAIEAITTPQLLSNTVQKFESNPALVYQDSEENWQTVTYKEYEKKVHQTARAFIKLGLERRSSVGVLSYNCPEWFYSGLGAIYAGGVVAGIYTTNSPEAVQHVLETSNASICVVDDTQQMEKIRLIKSRLPNLKIVIQIHGPFESYVGTDDGYYKWSDIEEMNTDQYEDELQQRIELIVPNECCAIIFTSGTTGYPKGAMMSHDNIIWQIIAASGRFENYEIGSEVMVSYLPLNHAAALILDIFLAIKMANCIYFADKNAMKGTLVKTMIKARPTRFLGVPRVWEKFHEKLIAVEASTNWFNRYVLYFAKQFVFNYHKAIMEGGQGNAFTYNIGEKVVRRIKTQLGLDRCKGFMTGAAPTSTEVKNYFCSLDIKLFETYGMSETGAIALGDSTLTNFQAIGKPFESMEIRINQPDQYGVGEIFIKSRSNCMGYLNDPTKTKDSFEDNWFKSGDLGHIDEHGDLYITGRIKELIITAGGENIPFVHIEESVKKEVPAISNVLLIGDKRKFLTLLITIKTEMDLETGYPQDNLKQESLQWIQTLKLNYTKLSEILKSGPCPIVLKSLQDGIDRYNKTAISSVHSIKKFAILPHDFSMATNELGATLKLKRSFVQDKYKDIIDGFYV